MKAIPKGKVIYVPKGAAREYAPLAANVYDGCSHACRYCYAPACRHVTREAFAKAKERPFFLDRLQRDAAALQAKGENTGPVLLSFTCDPYQPLEEELAITCRAIGILGRAGLKVRILTKNGALAARDLELFKRHDVEVGVTLCSWRESFRMEWEPGAGSIKDRYSLLGAAHKSGLRTWVSIEPVFYPVQALGVIVDTTSVVDTFKIGKLNHDKAREAAIDWRAFLRDALTLLEERKAGYIIKDALWALADKAIRDRWPKERRQA